MAAGHVVQISVRRFGRLPLRSRVRFGVYTHTCCEITDRMTHTVTLAAHARHLDDGIDSEVLPLFTLHGNVPQPPIVVVLRWNTHL